MKKYFKFFSVAAIVAAGLVGCSSEEPVDSDKDGSKAGELTAATFSFPDLQATKGPAISDASEANTIASLRLLVYNWNSGQTGECQVDTVIMASNPTATVLVTSGDKTILVLANDHTAAPSGPITDLTSKFKLPSQKGKSLDQLYKANKTYNANHTYLNEYVLGQPDLTTTPGALTDLVYSSIAGPANFFFSNSVADSSSKKTLVGNITLTDSQNGGAPDDSKNHFRIYVKRSVAKISAYTSAATAIPIPVKDLKGTLGVPKYGFRNQNRGVALFQVPTSSLNKPQSPFYDVINATTATAVLNDLNTYKPYWWTNGTATELGGTMPIGTTAPSNPTYYYVPENANAKAVNGNTTYLAIEAVYTPNPGTVVTSFVAVAAMGGVTSYVLGNVATPTFYRVKAKTPAGVSLISTFGKGLIPNEALFATLTEANRFFRVVTNNGDPAGASTGTTPESNANIEVEEFTNGNCYYRLNVGNTGEIFVARNNRYLINIKSFNTIGAPKLGDLDTDPGTPIEEPTYVTATVTISPWNQINQEGEV